MKILRIMNVTKKFEGIIALNSCSFEVDQNSITGIIGPNGAGKTTLFNVITGLEKLDEGKIYFKNRGINDMKVYERTRLGITRTFQVIKVFNRLTLFENMKSSILFRLSKGNGFDWKERAENLLSFVGLYHLKDELAMNLSYGQQKLLEFAMSLMPEPDLIMLDEPVSGVNPVLINKIQEYIKTLYKQGKTFLIIEHNMPFVMSICEKIVVLDAGKKIAEGDPESIRKSKRVLDAYLGEG
jgi:branched-chain amino acid transport system ATP-binding protein/neutral amino acid transport system ATP-binding protein